MIYTCKIFINLPFLCKFIILITFINMILTNIYMLYYNTFSLSSNNIFSNIYLWTLFTSMFVPSSVVNFMFVNILFVFKAVNLERSLGTLRYTIYIILDNLFCSAYYLIITLIVNKYYSFLMHGMLSITVCQSTLLCLANKDTNLKFFSIKINSNLYPLVLGIFLLILNNLAYLEIIIGYISAIIYYYLLRYQINENIIIYIELNIYKIINYLKILNYVDINTNYSNTIQVSKKSISKPIRLKNSLKNCNKISDKSIVYDNYDYYNTKRDIIIINKLAKESSTVETNSSFKQVKKLSNIIVNKYNYSELNDEKTL